MNIKNGLLIIAIIGAVLMGGPIAALGQTITTVNCSNKITEPNRNEVRCGQLIPPVNIGVDVKEKVISSHTTLPRTASSNQTTYVNQGLLPGKVRKLIDSVSKQLNLNPQLVRAVAMTESSGNQRAVSPAGAVGVMQLMPGTARGLGVNPYDLEQNILGGGLYLKRQLERHEGNISLALAAYNAGPGAVEKYQGVPPFRETREYITRVLTTMGRD